MLGCPLQVSAAAVLCCVCRVTNTTCGVFFHVSFVYVSACVPTQHAACVVCVQAWAVILLPHPCCLPPPCCCEGATLGLSSGRCRPHCRCQPRNRACRRPTCSCVCDVVLPGTRIGKRGREAGELVNWSEQGGGAHLCVRVAAARRAGLGMNPRGYSVLLSRARVWGLGWGAGCVRNV